MSTRTRIQKICTALMLAVAVSSCQAQAPRRASEGCTAQDRVDAAAAVQLHRVTGLADLVRQVHRNLASGILCTDPEVLEQRWGIQIEGRWRVDRRLREIPRKRVENKTYYPPPLERFIVTSIPERGDLIVQFAPGQAVAGESLLPVTELLSLLGDPEVRVDTTHPSPTPGTVVPSKSGPFPDSILVWQAPVPGTGSVLARTAFGSEIVNLHFSNIVRR
jgi:hypothetical protein